MNQRNAPVVLIAALFVLGAAMPFVLKPYHLNMLTEIILFALYAVSYNLLLGYAGLLSFGHAMFFGMGAFTVAVSLIHIPGLSIWSAIGLALAMTTAVGFVTGGLLLRHKGSYFALLTLAFNSLFYAVATKWHTITGGDDGLSVTRPDLALGFTTVSLAGIESFYGFTLVIVGSAIAFCWYFTQTAMGQTVLMMRENEERMKFLGYNTNISRLILFTFTGAVAGLAGAFYTLHFQFCSQSAISVDMTTTVLLMTFVGGTGTFWGPMLGALVYIVLQNYLSDITDRWPLFMGLIFVFMVLFIPGGLSQIIQSARDLIAGRRGTGKPMAAKEASS
ncbi:MAG: branched-chain amino acid ABC transporter permease [Syntrophaceae bacterium]|nr:branched-chain amino acid ABC transporter permease [Syntrophaceae bacterium]